MGAFGRAANVIYEAREGRPFWKLRPLQLLVTLVMVLLLTVVVVAIVLTGPVVEAVADPLGLGATAVDVWDYAKWPFLAVAVVVMLGLLYYATPNVRQRSVRAVIPGVVLGLAVWAVASVGFAFYVANFGTYDRTYGTLGGMVVLLVWLWLDQRRAAPRGGAERRARAQQGDRRGGSRRPARDPARAPGRSGAARDDLSLRPGRPPRAPASRTTCARARAPRAGAGRE